MSEAQRIIYVCSNHKLPSKNIMDFASTKGDTSSLVGKEPFFPKRVIPVDISPHSLRCELVICLERLDVTKLPKSTRPPISKLGVNTYNPRNFDYKVNKFSRYPRGGVRGARRGFIRGMSAMRSAFVRDSFYPLPLRGVHPYQNGGPGRGFRKPMYAPHPPPPPSHPRPYPRGYDYASPPPLARGPPSPYGPRHPRDYEEDHYSELRRDVEDAIDSYPPPRGAVNRRLAMANVMLEQGLRMATEAMADDYPIGSPPASYIRRGRGSMGSVLPSRGGLRMERSMGMDMGMERGMGFERGMEREMGMERGMVMERDMGMDRRAEWGMNRSSWGGDGDNAWQSNWTNDNYDLYEMAPPKIPQRPMRGMRGGPIRGRGGSRAGKLQGGGVWRH